MRRVLVVAVLPLLLAVMAAAQEPQPQQPEPQMPAAQMPAVQMPMAQTPDQYLDVYVVKVKPEKRADFDAAARKIIDANRRNNGDTWLASETMYGDQNTVSFITPRQSFGEIEQGFTRFETALAKAYGKEGAKKLEQDWDSCLVSARGEIWRRRWDLSNGPSDTSAMNRLVGESRWLRTMVVRVRPGKTPEFEDMARMIKDAIVKSDPNDVYLISQAIAGESGNVFRITTLKPSLANFDTMGQHDMKKLLGEEGYQKYVNTVADTVLTSETLISRFSAELSNAPQEIVAVAPAFWSTPEVLAATPRTPRAKRGMEARR